MKTLTSDELEAYEELFAQHPDAKPRNLRRAARRAAAGKPTSWDLRRQRPRLTRTERERRALESLPDGARYWYEVKLDRAY